MTDEPDDDGDKPYDGPCSVCGETVKGTRYVALGLFAAVSEEGSGLHFTPDEPTQEFADWESVPLTNCVHAVCFQLYLDGLMADLSHRRRIGEPDTE